MSQRYFVISSEPNAKTKGSRSMKNLMNPIELTDEEQRAVEELCEKRGLTGRDLAVLFLNALGVYPPNAKKAS